MDLILGIAVSNIDIPRRLKPTRKYWGEGHFHAIHASTAKKCNETGTLLIFNEYKRVWGVRVNGSHLSLSMDQHYPR